MPASGCFLPGEHAEERGLAGAVRADDADDAAGRQGERQILDQELVAHVLLQAVDLDHLAAEAGAVGDDDLGAGELVALGLVGQFLVAR